MKKGLRHGHKLSSNGQGTITLSPGRQASEIGAKLLAGLHDELGLTKEQAAPLLNRYILALEKEHGEAKLRETTSSAPDEIGRKIIDFLDYKNGGRAPEGTPGTNLAGKRPDLLRLRLRGTKEVGENAREIASRFAAKGNAAYSYRDGILEGGAKSAKSYATPVYPERTRAWACKPAPGSRRH